MKRTVSGNLSVPYSKQFDICFELFDGGGGDYKTHKFFKYFIKTDVFTRKHYSNKINIAKITHN